MKKVLVILMSLMMLSCEKDQVQTQVEDAVVLKGILVAGDQSVSVQLGTIQSIGDSSMEMPLSNASVFIAGGGQGSAFGEAENLPGEYSTPLGELVVIPGHEYSVDIVVEGEEISATAFVPEPLAFVDISDPSLMIDENDPGQLVFEASWEESEGYEYVFVLEAPTENPVQIDFSVPSGNFDAINNLPTEKTFLRIYDTDLEYYGSHLLHIYKVDLAYSELFRYSPGIDHNVFNGPDNVLGGVGYLTGVAKVTLELEVEEL